MLQMISFLLLLCLCAGCTVGPVYQIPDIDIPSTWHSQTSAPLSADLPVCWWDGLQDSLLTELLGYAASQNLDLHIAATRILQARTESKAKTADYYPRIDGSMACGHLYYSKDALVNGLLGNTTRKSHIKRNVDFYEAGFDAEWEIDLFGYTAHEVAAAKANEQATQENLCAVWVALSAEIAKNYIELRGLQQQQQIAKNIFDAQVEVIALNVDLVARGLVSQIDHSLAKAELAVLQADMPRFEFAIACAIHRLSILLGYPPGGLFDCLAAPAPLPAVPPNICIGVPSELLRRRPDIRKAERELAAATERVGSAIAALFPRFSLRGFIGDISTHAGALFNPASLTWLAGPQLLLPIFNSRLLLQSVDYNKLATQAALYTYQKVILEALEEAENSIASFKYKQEALVHLKDALNYNREAFLFASDLQSRGVDDHFGVIKARKPFLSAENLLVQARVDLLINYVSLYKALGGSWSDNLPIE